MNLVLAGNQIVRGRLVRPTEGGRGYASAGAFAIAIIATGIVTAGVSFNALFFVLSFTGLALATLSSLRNGALYALAYMCVKPAYWRLAYHLDKSYSLAPQFDILRYSAGLFLGLICAVYLAQLVIEGGKLTRTKLGLVALMFVGINAVSIFNPQSGLFLGLAGFERNIFPTFFVFFVARDVIRNRDDYLAFLKVTLGIGLLTLLYGLKHSVSGVFGFETTFLTDFFSQRGYDGWLTIGINGVEFRNFSTFFGYMEFTFTLALWAIVISIFKPETDQRWLRIGKRLFLVLTVVVLALTMERTPTLMVIGGALYGAYVLSSKRRKKQVLVVCAIVVAVIIGTISVFERQLEESGIAKLQRLAEVSDPSKASSIEDRVHRMWIPTLNIIASNPMGVGIGYGSETIASEAVSGSSYRVQPHNEILQKALETGLPGAGLLVALLVMIWRTLRHHAEQVSERWLRRALAAGCGVTLAFVLCAQINLPYSGAQGVYFWFLTGALVGLCEEVDTTYDAANAEGGLSE